MSPLWDKEYQRKVAGAERADERKRQFNRMIEGLKAKAKKSARAKDL